MKCPHCKKNIKIEKVKSGRESYFDYSSLFVVNLMLFALPYAIIAGWLNDHTSIPLSLEDGLSINLYLIPMIIWAVYIAVYCWLYEYKKVKGTFLYKPY